MNQPTILAFAGSIRRASHNKKLIRIAVRGAEQAGATVTLIDLADYPLPIYNGDLEAESGLPDNALALKRLFLDHRGLLLACPEYNSSITPLLKNALDWVSRSAEGEKPLACYKGKLVGLVSASPGALGGLRGLVHVRAILGNIGCLVLPEQRAINRAGTAFDEHGELRDADQVRQVEQVGARLAELLRKLG